MSSSAPSLLPLSSRLCSTNFPLYLPSTLLLLLFLLVPPPAAAWGSMAHEAVAYVAGSFVRPATASHFHTLLGDPSPDYLAAVAAWADSYRATDAGAFSAPFHFIDARDGPPASCGIDMDRDCGEAGCVVSAIANYTGQLLDSSLGKSEQQMAAKLVGDVGQPLHCESLDAGGNDITVTYGREATNLHRIWDNEIPESISGGSSMAAAKTWAASLTAEIASGSYNSSAGSWVAGMDVAAANATALAWARESNADVCSTVLAHGMNYVESSDLSGEYTTAARPVVNLQIAKQGYRLAKWLDAIAAAA